MKPKLVVILGPTASGKSDWAIRLAKEFNGEIVNADSRQVYTEMPIGSAIVAGVFKNVAGAKVYVAGGVVHHLVSFREPNQPITLAKYRVLAMAKILDITKRGRTAFLVGGTGLYINSVIQNFAIPAVAPNLKLRSELETQNTTILYQQLLSQDPEYAAKIDQQNRRYIIRALEVFQTTGEKFSVLQQKNESIFEVLEIGIEVGRDELYQKIDRRFDQQITSGLIEETLALGQRYNWDKTVLVGLGHRELMLFLKQQLDLKEAVNLAKKNIRHYAKRQLTWFKRDRFIHWCNDIKIVARLIKNFLKP